SRCRTAARWSGRLGTLRERGRKRSRRRGWRWEMRAMRPPPTARRDAFAPCLAHNERMAFDFRRLAVALSGFCTFLNLYSPQALLPELSREFGASAAEISTIMTAGTLAVALTAPITGAIADVVGRP